MSMIGMPSLAMLLVLTNFTLCLCVDREKYPPNLERPATVALSPSQLGRAHGVEPSDDPDGAAVTAIIPLRAD